MVCLSVIAGDLVRRLSGRMRRPLTTTCVNVSATIYDSDQSVDITSIWPVLMWEFYRTITSAVPCRV